MGEGFSWKKEGLCRSFMFVWEVFAGSEIIKGLFEKFLLHWKNLKVQFEKFMLEWKNLKIQFENSYALFHFDNVPMSGLW